MISGFMVVKNVIKQGYPFLEAIASALPICDEFLISDGYSDDGTYEVLQRITNLNPKVKVYQYRWPDKKDPSVLADVTNEVRGKCRFQYIFSVQANEIIHEQTALFIKALPSMLPEIETFCLPYIQLLNNYKFSEEFRLRFSKNLPRIVAIDDAWTLGISSDFVRNKKLRSLANPRRLSNHLSNGIWYVYANLCRGPLSRAMYLPQPIFRYWSLFPRNFLEKYQRHIELSLFSKSFLKKYQNFEELQPSLQSHVDDPEVFWKLCFKILSEARFNQNIQYPEAFAYVDRKDHPALVQEFISNQNTDHYYVRNELFETLKKS
jgi:glycosyltransferase involved in cell wall biosynthesis